jgi:small-conductance mechanosensitive channel/CRP-like cAMP-binding protein
VQASLSELLRAGVPALLILAGAVAVIRVVCRRPGLRRLSLVLSLAALAGATALFRHLVPGEAALVDPYLRFLLLFVLLYGAFKVVEVLVVDLLPGRHRRAPPPAILRDVVAVAAGGLILVGLLRASFGVDVAALVATSAALSIVLGLALQETLANLFAGLGLMLERPFEPGDWVRLGALVGRVEEVSWRAVRLKLIRQEDFLVIPNSVVAKSEIVNMSQPLPVHGHTVEVFAGHREAPHRVREILLEAVRDVEGVLVAPPPRARVVRFESFAVAYQLTYYLSDYARINDLEGEVLARVWYAFRRHGIPVPYPTSDVNWRDAVKVEAERRQAEVARIAGLLRGVAFLEVLTPEQLERLAAEARLVPHPAGLAVVRQGEPGDSLFVVAAGRVEVSVHAAGGGPEQPLATLGVGDYFGEMSLLTGTPRTATIRTLDEAQFVVLTKEALRPLVVGEPGVAERLSETLAKRQAERDDAVQRAALEAREPGEDGGSQVLARMRRFFGLAGHEAARW